LHAHAGGAERDLLQRDDRAFVGLGMRPRPDAGAGDAGPAGAAVAVRRRPNVARRVGLSI
jgi:hypothetical protein